MPRVLQLRLMRKSLIVALLTCLSQIGLASPLLTDWKDDSGEHHTGKIRRTEVDAGRWGSSVVRIYLPEAYTDTSTARFPVLYACDGNNCFQPGVFGREQDWHLDEVVDGLIKSSQLRPLFVVTINHPDDRFGAYTSRRIWRKGHQDGGGAKDYADFVLRVKETIDSQFPTVSDDAGILGSSLGGLFSLYASYQHGDQFSRAAVMSPSFWWMGRPGIGELVPGDKLASGPTRLWIDMGTDEERDDPDEDEETKKVVSAQYVELASSMTAWLQSQQGPGRKIQFTSIQGGLHRETAWHARLAEVLRWLYAP